MSDLEWEIMEYEHLVAPITRDPKDPDAARARISKKIERAMRSRLQEQDGAIQPAKDDKTGKRE
jgi:hypothetical protein